MTSDSGHQANALRPDLEYLIRAADAVQAAIDAGAHDEASQVFDHLLEAVDVELVARGNVAGEPALFEDLLLAAQLEREVNVSRIERGERT